MLEPVEGTLQLIEFGLFKVAIENDNETDKILGNIVEDLGSDRLRSSLALSSSVVAPWLSASRIARFVFVSSEQLKTARTSQVGALPRRALKASVSPRVSLLRLLCFCNQRVRDARSIGAGEFREALVKWTGLGDQGIPRFGIWSGLWRT